MHQMRCLAYSLLFVFIASASSAQEEASLNPNLNPNLTPNIGLDSSSLAIKDKRKNGLKAYIQTDRVVFPFDGEIPLNLSILNNGMDANLQLSQRYQFLNYTVEVYSKDGYSVQERDSFFANRFNVFEHIRELKNNQAVNLKSTDTIPFLLRSHAMTGFEVDLNKIYKLMPGQYLVRFKFYPASITENPNGFIYSPYIQVIIKSQQQKIKNLSEKSSQAKKEELQYKSAEDIIHIYFDSRKDKDWKSFFQVLDLKKLINIYNEFGYTYRNAKEDDRPFIIDDFTTYLKDIIQAERLVSYDIENIFIRKNQATAKVVVKTYLHGNVVSREYQFTLSKKYFWQITAYTVLQK